MQLSKGKNIISACCLNTLTSSTHINQTKPLFNQAVKPNGILILFCPSFPPPHLELGHQKYRREFDGEIEQVLNSCYFIYYDFYLRQYQSEMESSG